MGPITQNFWNNRRVFITGHTGFKGTWLSLWLHRLGAKLSGYSLSPTEPLALFDSTKTANCFENSIFGDIRDFERLSLAINEASPEVIFHMAAQSLVRESYADPLGTYSTNVLGTAHVLEAVRKASSVRSVVVVTSDKCYENQESIWGYRETDPMGGSDPYSSSKGCAELITAAYRRSFFRNPVQQSGPVGLATARAGNVIGGGDSAKDRLVPDIFRALLMGEKISIRNPASVRPWQHVLEPLCGYIALAEKLYEYPDKYGAAFNFGPSRSDIVSVEWVVNRVCNIWGQGAQWVLTDSVGPHEASLLSLDSSRAILELSWSPVWNISDALEHTVDWVQKTSSGVCPQSMTLSQIKQYESLLTLND